MTAWLYFIAVFLCHWLYTGAVWQAAACGWISVATYRRLFSVGYLTVAIAVVLFFRALLAPSSGWPA